VLLAQLEPDRAAELDELGLGEQGVAIAWAHSSAARSRPSKREKSSVSGSSAR
jgi:hypothetical protein